MSEAYLLYLETLKIYNVTEFEKTWIFENHIIDYNMNNEGGEND